MNAPAVSEATVGVAMGAGTDVARESADVVLIGNDLMKFVETVRVAKSCRSIILQNLYGTLIVDTIGIGLAAVGYLNPLLAAFIHVASELTFILNSTRLLPPREAEVVFWIEQNWLQASVADQGKRRFYIITPEALKDLYRHHHGDLMKRGIRNQSLFEAYVEYCFAPKHTVGEQLLEVRREKRERAEFAAATGNGAGGTEEEDESDDADCETDAQFRLEFVEKVDGASGDLDEHES